MHLFPEHCCFKAGIVISLLWIIVSPVTAADIDREGYLGETITLHGYSYVGDSVYLFLTGPGLPENGVTLTNTDLRADQGHFTVVPLDDRQAWTYIWKTSRIANEIDPGTYTVYVTNKPVDKAHLGGASGYKTYAFFLKDSGNSKVSIEAAKVYTRNPYEQTPALLPSTTAGTPKETPAVTPVPSTIATTVPVQATVPATRAGTGPFAAVAVLTCCAWLAAFFRIRH